MQTFLRPTSLSVSDRGTIITAADLGLTITIVARTVTAQFNLYARIRLEGLIEQAVKVSKPDENANNEKQHRLDISFVWVIKKDVNSTLNTTIIS
jgi:hypothetical protein